ncbi:hypothetical protein H1R20_g1263, partial [Candolleomyces eurysporus]
MPPTSHIIVQVSKYWRDVAKGTPQVWDHWVVLDSFGGAEVEGKLQKYFLAIYNLYGKNMTRVHYWTNPSTKFLAPLLHTGQYTSLRIVGSVDGIRNVQGAMDMPLLEKLVISEIISESSPPIAFNTPKLKTLSLYSSADILSRFVLPWNQITDFTYGPSYPLSISPGEITLNVLEVLQRLPNLTNLHLISGSNTQESVRVDPHTTLSNLRTFEIHDYGLSLLGRQPMLHSLRAPLLERFDLVIPGGTATSSIEPYNHASQQLTAFLHTSSCLQQIRIVFVLRRDRHGLSFTEHEPRKTAKTIYIQGKAPVFRELPSKILPNGHIKELGSFKVLDYPKPVLPRSFVKLDRYIDRFLGCEDSSSRLERSPEGPPAKHIDPFVDPLCHPCIKVLCDIMSEFTTDGLNMELYLQTYPDLY